MKSKSGKTRCVAVLIVLVLVLMAVPGTGSASETVDVTTTGEKGILEKEWNASLNKLYGWGLFGSSPGIANLPDVNKYGYEPDSDLEIITGSDGWNRHYNPGVYMPGLWRAFDSRGNVEWYKNTHCDESRGSVNIVDLNGDGYTEIAGATTSGYAVEVMDRFGNFVWTFPVEPMKGITLPSVAFEFPGSPAAGDITSAVEGIELVEVHRPTGLVLAFDGDNSDGIDDGIHFNDYPIWGKHWNGEEGEDWDVIWVFNMNSTNNFNSAAIEDVDCDGQLEVITCSNLGGVFILDGATGYLEHMFDTGEIQASAAIANLDNDNSLEIVVGSSDHKIYAFQWNGYSGMTEWEYNAGSGINSSAAIGNIDNDSELEIVVGTGGGDIIALNANGYLEWSYSTEGPIFSSPALADRNDIDPYDIEWQMFRHDSRHTGYYKYAENPLDIYIGSSDHYLYLIDGNTGDMIDRFLTTGPIATSPSVADVDGDGMLNIVFYSWGIYNYPSPVTNDTFWNLEDTHALPTADAGPDQTINEGDVVTFDGSGSHSPNGFIQTYSWDVDGNVDSDGDGNPTNDMDRIGPNPTYIYGDDGVFQVTLKITDSTGQSDTDTMNVTVMNLAPVAEIEAYTVVNLTFRAAGEKYHSVNFTLLGDDGKIAMRRITRRPGSPNRQGRRIVGVRIDLFKNYTVVVEYTPNDPSLNGRCWGATPVWVIITFEDGSKKWIHHTFNVRRRAGNSSHPNHVDPWKINLKSNLTGGNISFEAEATDPGSDDLMFLWDWGDGNTTGWNTYYNNGLDDDTYPSPDGIFPVSAVDLTKKSYSEPCDYCVVLTVCDDDGGETIATLDIPLGS